MLLILALCALAGTSPVDALPPPFYSAKDIQATVVHEETGHPLPDVVVVALWELRPISGRGPRLHVAEAVTDANGKFFLPGWGPKARPPLTEFAHRSPLLILFKNGFVPLELHNEGRSAVERVYPNYRTMRTKRLREGILWLRGSPDDPLQDCIWNGLTIELEPFTGARDLWLSYLHGIKNRLIRDDVSATMRLHRALLNEQRYFVEAATGLVDRPARSFFFEIEERLREASR